jgi:hypothetical protein
VLRVPSAEGQLLGGRFVLDDDIDVVEHGDDIGREAVQGANDEPLEALPARLLDTASDPVVHRRNCTSFGVISPVLGGDHGRTYGAMGYEL